MLELVKMAWIFSIDEFSIKKKSNSLGIVYETYMIECYFNYKFELGVRGYYKLLHLINSTTVQIIESSLADKTSLWETKQLILGSKN